MRLTVYHINLVPFVGKVMNPVFAALYSKSLSSFEDAQKAAQQVKRTINHAIVLLCC